MRSKECVLIWYAYLIQSLLQWQTDLLVAAAKTGKIINIKKGQFCAPSVSESGIFISAASLQQPLFYLLQSLYLIVMNICRSW